jgi:hypothetical protein
MPNAPGFLDSLKVISYFVLLEGTYNNWIHVLMAVSICDKKLHLGKGKNA